MFYQLCAAYALLCYSIGKFIMSYAAIHLCFTSLFQSVRVRDIPQIALDNTRTQLSYLKELMSFLADTTLQTAANSPALNWMVGL